MVGLLPEIQLSYILLIYALCFFVSSLLVVYGIVEFGEDGWDATTISFLTIVIGISGWNLIRFFEFLFVSELITKVAISFIYPAWGAAIVPVLIFGLAFSGRDRWLTRKTITLLIIPIVLAFLAALTNPYHQLVWTGEFVTWQGWSGTEIVIFARDFNVVFVPIYLYFVGTAILGLLILLRFAITSPDVYKRQTLAIAIGALLAISAGTLYAIGQQPIVPDFVDLTPLGFVMFVLFAGYALTEPQSLNLVPVARDSVIDGMEDAYIVINPEGKIVDSNPTARQLVGVESNWTGMDAGEFFEPFSDQYEQFRDTESIDTEISIRVNGEVRHFDLKITSIDEHRAKSQGTLVVLRDITELKNREQELRDREEELDLLRQVQSRVLRHNIRNDLAVVRSYGEIFAEDFDDQHEQMAEQLVSTTDELLSVSNKARSVEQLVDEDQDPIVFDLSATLQNIVNQHQDQFTAVAFTLDIPEHRSVETIPAMQLAIENSIENAAEHNDAADPVVDISISQDDSATRISISDNGPGIPDHELEVLEEGEETDLKHGSGVGLWLIDWVRRNSNASINFDTSEGGTAVLISIPG